MRRDRGARRMGKRTIIDHQSSSAATPRVPVVGAAAPGGLRSAGLRVGHRLLRGWPGRCPGGEPHPCQRVPGRRRLRSAAEGFDFGSGAAVVTIGDERYEFSMAIETIDTKTYIGVCQELFGLPSRPKGRIDRWRHHSGYPSIPELEDGRFGAPPSRSTSMTPTRRGSPMPIGPPPTGVEGREPGGRVPEGRPVRGR